jgi:hypothetical protein
MKAVLLIILSGLTIVPLVAQQAVSVAGGNATGAGGTVSYTVGQVSYNTSNGINGTVAQGVQQPYELSVVTGLEEARDISLEIVVYPNPATDFIILKLKNREVENLRYHFYDLNGSLLMENKIEGNEITLSLQTLLNETYFLKVTDNNKVIKTFKIIKK